MTHPNPLDAIVTGITEDLAALLEALPAAQARQWDKSPVPRLYDSEERRSVGSAPTDPTADVVLDARRLAVREAVMEASRALVSAQDHLHRTRRKLERAVAWFDGE